MENNNCENSPLFDPYISESECDGGRVQDSSPEPKRMMVVETDGRKCCRATMFVYILLIIALLTAMAISAYFIVDYHDTNPSGASVPTNSGAVNNSDVPDSLSTCHWGDEAFPVDEECGVSVCTFSMGVQTRLFGLDAATPALMDIINASHYDMFDYLKTQYHGEVYPTIVHMQPIDKSKTFMTYDGHNMSLAPVHMSIEYFCCTPEDDYHRTIALYQEYEWEAFEITFGDLMCLKMTNLGLTIYILNLDDESEERMSVWTDTFEAYLAENGVTTGAVPRRDGQPFHVSFAIFDEYDDNMQSLSVGVLGHLNDKYRSKWISYPVMFEKDKITFY